MSRVRFEPSAATTWISWTAVSPPPLRPENTTYTLSATGPGGSDTNQATVTVQYCAAIVGLTCPGSQTCCLASPIVATNPTHAAFPCNQWFRSGTCFAQSIASMATTCPIGTWRP